MINKTLPNSYIIDIEGEKIGELFGEIFNIKSIKIESLEFDSDLSALYNGSMLIDVICGRNLLENAEEIREYNPLFYPNITPLEMSEEQKTDLEMAQQEADEMSRSLAANGQFAIPLTNLFDSLGDFISTRSQIKTEGLSVIMKTGVSLDAFMLEVYQQRGEKGKVATNIIN